MKLEVRSVEVRRHNQGASISTAVYHLHHNLVENNDDHVKLESICAGMYAGADTENIKI